MSETSGSAANAPKAGIASRKISAIYDLAILH